MVNGKHCYTLTYYDGREVQKIWDGWSGSTRTVIASEEHEPPCRDDARELHC